MSTHHSIALKPLLSSVPQRKGSGSRDFAAAELDVNGTVAPLVEPTLSFAHLRKLTVPVPAMVGAAIRAQLPLSS